MSGRFTRWQFSIREMFLAFTAILAIVAAIVAVVEKNRSLEFSPFLESFDAVSFLTTSAESVGATLETPSNGKGGGGGSREGMSYRHHVLIATPDAKRRYEIMTEFMALVETALSENGCVIGGNGISGGPGDVSSFDFDYKYGKTRGFFYADCSLTENDNWRVVVITHEF